MEEGLEFFSQALVPQNDLLSHQNANLERIGHQLAETNGRLAEMERRERKRKRKEKEDEEDKQEGSSGGALRKNKRRLGEDF